MIVVGISGATCSGKTTVCNILQRIFINSRVFNQDTYYWPNDSPNHIREPTTGFINWEVASAFDMNRLHADLLAEVNSSTRHSKLPAPAPHWTVDKVFKRPDSLETIIDPRYLENIKLVLVEGILVLNDPRIAGLCDHKFFFELDHATCWDRRRHRTYDPQDQVGYFETLAWPFYLENLAALKQATGQSICYLKGQQTLQQDVCCVLNHLFSHKIS